MSNVRTAPVVLLANTTPAKKTNILPPFLFAPKQRKEKSVEVLKQMFVAIGAEMSIMITFQDISFGIRKDIDKYVSHINGTVTNGDGDYIKLIQSILRKKVIAGNTHEDIANELNSVAGTSTSIRIYHNHICEPIVKVPKPPRETIKKSLVFVPEKKITKFDKACEIMHTQTKLNYILFDKIIYYFPKKKEFTTAEKTKFRVRDMID